MPGGGSYRADGSAAAESEAERLRRQAAAVWTRERAALAADDFVYALIALRVLLLHVLIARRVLCIKHGLLLRELLREALIVELS